MSDENSSLSEPSGRFLGTVALGLGAAGLIALGQACPADDGGGLEPPTPLPSDDDDAVSDDDDNQQDDDDIAPPKGIPFGGQLQYQVADGALPAGEVRGGLFPVDGAVTSIGAEWHSDPIASAETGLPVGQATFAFYLPDTAEGATLAEVEPGVSGVGFLPFAYVDGDGSGGFNAGDTILTAAEDLVFWLEAEDEDDISDALDGAGAGWNLQRDAFGDPAWNHYPEGVNSSQGLSMRVRLVPVDGGDVPVEADQPFPEGSLIAAWHGTVTGLTPGDVPADPVRFVTPAVNTLRDPLVDWPIGGTPPAAHIGVLPTEVLGPESTTAGLRGVQYTSVGWVDDGDLVYDEAALCDLLVSSGDKTLVWLEPPGENLLLALRLAVFDEQRPGWFLLDTRPRRLTAGFSMTVDDGLGDDDDSSGPPYGMPEDCFPSGDDDDSAGDDDDSAGDDDDSATP